MTSTEIAVRQPATAAAVTERDVVDGWIGVATDVAKLADYIAETDFVPRALRNRPAAVAACILTGRELGIGPMASLKSIHMVQGVPSLSAEYKRARAMAAGHEIVIDETNATRCVMRGRRASSDRWLTVTWTLDMAKRAKLAGKDVWQQYPQRMLQARASSELCDLLFPDAALGLETTEVLEDGGEGVAYNMVTGDAAPAVAAGSAAAIEAPKPRTTQRRQRPPAEPDPPTGAPAASGSAGAAGSQRPAPTRPARSGQPSLPPTELIPAGTEHAGMPPLPGEEDTPGPAPDQGQPAGHEPATGPGAPDDTERPTSGQIGLIQSHFKRLGFDGDQHREARLIATTTIAGRTAPIGSTGDLTREEASAVVDTLSRCRTRERLLAVLDQADQHDRAPAGDQD